MGIEGLYPPSLTVTRSGAPPSPCGPFNFLDVLCTFYINRAGGVTGLTSLDDKRRHGNFSTLHIVRYTHAASYLAIRYRYSVLPSLLCRFARICMLSRDFYNEAALLLPVGVWL